MDVRRGMYQATIRLAVVLSTTAVVVALGLDAVGVVSRTALVLTVIVVGFAASWVQSGRATRATPTATRVRHHRVAVVPVRHPIG